MAKLQFDIDRLDTMRQEIEQAVIDLSNMNEALQKEMNELKEKWNTPAGEEFFKEQNLDWSEAVKDYIKVMTDMKEMIDYAISQYEPIQIEAEKITIPSA